MATLSPLPGSNSEMTAIDPYRRLFTWIIILSELQLFRWSLFEGSGSATQLGRREGRIDQVLTGIIVARVFIPTDVSDRLVLPLRCHGGAPATFLANKSGVNGLSETQYFRPEHRDEVLRGQCSPTCKCGRKGAGKFSLSRI
jgi:hypothetical protein